MVNIHITKSLQQRLGTPFGQPHHPDSPKDTLLETFCAKDFMLGRFRLVMAVNRSTRLALLIKLAPKATWLERLGLHLEGVLIRHGVDPITASREASALKHATLARNNDRRLMGTLNDLVSNIPYHLPPQPSEAEILRSQAKLNQTPHLRHEPHFVDQGIARLFGLPNAR